MRIFKVPTEEELISLHREVKTLDIKIDSINNQEKLMDIFQRLLEIRGIADDAMVKAKRDLKKDNIFPLF